MSQLYWINKKGVFGIGKNQKKYGSEISENDVGSSDRFKKFIKDGMIGEKLGEVVEDSKKDDSKEVSELKKEIEEIKANAGETVEKLTEDHAKEIEAKDSEIEKLTEDIKILEEAGK